MTFVTGAKVSCNRHECREENKTAFPPRGSFYISPRPLCLFRTFEPGLELQRTSSGSHLKTLAREKF